MLLFLGRGECVRLFLKADGLFEALQRGFCAWLRRAGEMDRGGSMVGRPQRVSTAQGVEGVREDVFVRIG